VPEHVLTQLDVLNRFLKRAQYEAFSFSVHRQSIRVRNESYANPDEHEYLVTISNGVPTRCSCPADRRYPEACKHRLAVAIREPVLSAAREDESSRVIADGGTQTAATPAPEEDEPPSWCGCAGLRGDFPCWECFSRGLKPLPDE
jgi:hypothetical protein